MSLRHGGEGNIYVLLSLTGAGKMKDYCLQHFYMQDFLLSFPRHHVPFLY